MGQAESYRALFERYPAIFQNVRQEADLHTERIGLMLAIENGSGIFGENETLDMGLKRLETLDKTYGRVVYIGMTWNSENRFGGGALTDVGLKADGRALLDFLAGKRIAFDASHTSDRMLQEALEYISARKHDIPVIASHSNLRAVNPVPRNLPDSLASEILLRGGIIGLNLYKPFVGPSDASYLVRQLKHLLHLGGEAQVCLGADFFYHGDLPPAYMKTPQEMFYADFGDSTAIPIFSNFGRPTCSFLRRPSKILLMEISCHF